MKSLTLVHGAQWDAYKMYEPPVPYRACTNAEARRIGWEARGIQNSSAGTRMRWNTPLGNWKVAAARSCASRRLAVATGEW